MEFFFLVIYARNFLASIMERFLSAIYIYKQIKILLQRASKNLKLAIIFKNYYFIFY